MKRPAVVFDLDDTIYPERMFVTGGIRAVATLLDVRFPRPGGWELVLTAVLESEGPFRLFDRGLAFCGAQRTPELIDELVDVFRHHVPVLEPWPGMVDLLAHLRASGIAIGLVTDGYLDVQQSKWRALGLEKMFDAVVFCADVDGLVRPKPDRAAFVKVATELGTRMGVDPDPLVYVGDNPARDFPAPDALGWQTVRVCRPGTWHALEPDIAPGRRTAADTPALKCILDRLAGI